MEIHDLTYETQTINLLKERFCINKKIDPNFIKFDIRKIRDVHDYNVECMLYEMEKIIAYEDKTWIVEYDVPSSLWQFIKMEYLPRFVRKLFPVKFTKLKFEVSGDVKYIDIPVSLQDKNPKVVIRQFVPNWPAWMEKLKSNVVIVKNFER